MDFQIHSRGGEIFCVIDGVESRMERRDMFRLIAQANTALWTTEPDVVSIETIDLGNPSTWPPLPKK
jgi:hypothetical protein